MSEVFAATSSPRALVVEDDVDVLALLGSHLRRLGCTVTLVTTAEEALVSATGGPPGSGRHRHTAPRHGRPAAGRRPPG